MRGSALRRWTALALCLMALAACSGGGGTPEGAVESYVNALIAGDSVEVINLSCAAWEEQAATEASSFESVEVTVDGLACQNTGADDEGARIACTGRIVAVYNGEQQELPLEGRLFRAVQEDGEWKMCGYLQDE